MQVKQSKIILVIFSIITLSTLSVISCFQMLTSDLFIMAKNSFEFDRRLINIYGSLFILALAILLLQFIPVIRKAIIAVTHINWKKMFVLLTLSIFNSLLFFFAENHESAFFVLTISVPLLTLLSALVLISNQERYFKNTRLFFLITICQILGLRILIKLLAMAITPTFTAAQSGNQFVQYQDYQNEERFYFIFKIPLIITLFSVLATFLIFKFKQSLFESEETQTKEQQEYSYDVISAKNIFRTVCWRKVFITVFCATIFFNLLTLSRNFDINKLAFARIKMAEVSINNAKLYSICIDLMMLIPQLLMAFSFCRRKQIQLQTYIALTFLGICLEVSWITYVYNLSMLIYSLGSSFIIGAFSPSVLMIPLSFQFKDDGPLFSSESKQEKIMNICLSVLAFSCANLLFSFLEAFNSFHLLLINQMELIGLCAIFTCSYILFVNWSTSNICCEAEGQNLYQTVKASSEVSFNSDKMAEQKQQDQYKQFDKQQTVEFQGQIVGSPRNIQTNDHELKNQTVPSPKKMKANLKNILTCIISFLIFSIPLTLALHWKKTSHVEEIEELRLKRNYYQNYCNKSIIFRPTKPLFYPRALNTQQKIQPIAMNIISSGRRYDFEVRTLDSFFKNNDYPITKIIAVDDDYINDAFLDLVKKYPNITFVSANCRMGQLAAIDLSLTLIDTEIYYNTQQDWEMFLPGYFDEALPVMKQHLNYAQALSARASKMIKQKYKFGAEIPAKFLYQSLSFNPSLRRKSHYNNIFYKRFLGFSGFTNWDSWGTGSGVYELCISQQLNSKGFTGYITKEQQITHIGETNRLKRVMKNIDAVNCER